MDRRRIELIRMCDRHCGCEALGTGIPVGTLRGDESEESDADQADNGPCTPVTSHSAPHSISEKPAAYGLSRPRPHYQSGRHDVGAILVPMHVVDLIFGDPLVRPERDLNLLSVELQHFKRQFDQLLAGEDLPKRVDGRVIEIARSGHQRVGKLECQAVCIRQPGCICCQCLFDCLAIGMVLLDNCQAD